MGSRGQRQDSYCDKHCLPTSWLRNQLSLEKGLQVLQLTSGLDLGVIFHHNTQSIAIGRLREAEIKEERLNHQILMNLFHYWTEDFLPLEMDSLLKKWNER